MKNVIHLEDPEKILSLYTLFIKNRVTLTLSTTSEESVEFIINDITVNNTLQIEYLNTREKTKLEENKLYNITCDMEGASYTFVSHYELEADRLCIPTIITIIDKRAYERFGTEKFPSPYIRVRVYGKEHTFILCDLSQGGLAFLASVKIAESFKQGGILEIYEIGSKKFTVPIKGIIIHCAPYQSKSFQKVGIQFSEIPNLD